MISTNAEFKVGATYLCNVCTDAEKARRRADEMAMGYFKSIMWVGFVIVASVFLLTKCGG